MADTPVRADGWGGGAGGVAVDTGGRDDWGGGVICGGCWGVERESGGGVKGGEAGDKEERLREASSGE